MIKFEGEMTVAPINAETAKTNLTGGALFREKGVLYLADARAVAEAQRRANGAINIRPFLIDLLPQTV